HDLGVFGLNVDGGQVVVSAVAVHALGLAVRVHLEVVVAPQPDDVAAAVEDGASLGLCVGVTEERDHLELGTDAGGAYVGGVHFLGAPEGRESKQEKSLLRHVRPHWKSGRRVPGTSGVDGNAGFIQLTCGPSPGLPPASTGNGDLCRNVGAV